MRLANFSVIPIARCDACQLRLVTGGAPVEGAVQPLAADGRWRAPEEVYTERIYPVGVMKTAKVFRHGNSQAVRLPKEYRFDADEVLVTRTPSGVLLMPKRITIDQLNAVLAQFRGRFVRRQPALQKRRWR